MSEPTHLLRQECRVVTTGIAQAAHQAVGITHSLEIIIGGITTRGLFAVLGGANVAGISGIDWLTQNHALIDVVDDSMLVQGRRVKLVDLRAIARARSPAPFGH